MTGLLGARELIRGSRSGAFGPGRASRVSNEIVILLTCVRRPHRVGGARADPPSEAAQADSHSHSRERHAWQDQRDAIDRGGPSRSRRSLCGEDHGDGSSIHLAEWSRGACVPPRRAERHRAEAGRHHGRRAAGRGARRRVHGTSSRIFSGSRNRGSSAPRTGSSPTRGRITST